MPFARFWFPDMPRSVSGRDADELVSALLRLRGDDQPAGEELASRIEAFVRSPVSKDHLRLEAGEQEVLLRVLDSWDLGGRLTDETRDLQMALRGEGQPGGE